MKKKYPKFEDYDFSDCREITGDELYRINGGGRIQPEQNENPPEGDSSNNSDSYTVQSGDTLSQIVYDYNQANGTHFTVDEVAQLSGIENPDFILPGQSIVFGNSEQDGETGQPVDPTAQGGQIPQSPGEYSTPNVESSSSTSNASAYNASPINQMQTYGGTGIINESQNVTISDSIGNLTDRGYPSSVDGFDKEKKQITVRDNYSIDYKNKVVKVDIKNKESYEIAYLTSVIKSQESRSCFRLQITDGNDIVHTFSNIETAGRFVSSNGFSSNLIRNEKKVEAYLENIKQNPDEYSIEAYQRRALNEGKKTPLKTHSLYVITEKSTGDKSTLSFNGTFLAPYSQGAWGLNTKTDVNGWNSYVKGPNKYDMELYGSRNEIDVEKTVSNIIDSINSDTLYYYRDHLKDKLNRENCNTALFATAAYK